MPALEAFKYEGDRYVLVREDKQTSLVRVLIALIAVLFLLLFEARYRVWGNARTLEAYAYNIKSSMGKRDAEIKETLGRIEGELNARRNQEPKE